MAKAPSALFRREDFGDLTDSGTLDRFLRMLNGFAQETKAGFTKGLTLGENAAAFWKTITVAGQAWRTPTLLNSWVYFGAPYAPPGFYKKADGDVRVRFILKGGAAASAAFELPVGYRPAYPVLVSGNGDATAGSTHIRCQVQPEGIVALAINPPAGWTSPTGWVAADFTFRAEDAPTFAAAASFKNELGSKPRAVLVANAYDSESRIPYPIPHLPWATKDDQIQIAAPSSVPPGRKATLTLLVLGG